MRYPIGIQNFPEIARDGWVYADKTGFIKPLIEGGKYYFLGRPRRFGKSLFLSTLEAFFLGKRELFRGLAIDSWEEWEWKEHPVIRIDLNAKNYLKPNALEERISAQLSAYEKKYGVDESEDPTIYGRFYNLIVESSKKMGMPAVVLIDEYDKPILDTMHSHETEEMHRDKLCAFYSVLKSADEYVKLGFLTGITKFGQLSIFSGLNNLQDISLNDKYAAVCGITEEELHRYFDEGVKEFAQKRKLSDSEAYDVLKLHYDGYHFSEESPDIYNPWSVLNALANREIREYWNASGGPASFLYKLLINGKMAISSLDDLHSYADALYGTTISIESPVPILYQSGYLTIKDIVPGIFPTLYTLGFPNREVESGFLNGLLARYTNLTSVDSQFNILKFVMDIMKGRCEEFLNRINAFFADFPYENALEVEKHFQNVMYCIIKLMGLQVDVEYHTSNGRIDMVIKTPDYIYVIEFKRDSTPEEALKQIEEKGYAAPFRADSRQLILAGVNFSTTLRRIDGIEIRS